MQTDQGRGFSSNINFMIQHETDPEMSPCFIQGISILSWPGKLLKLQINISPSCPREQIYFLLGNTYMSLVSYTTFSKLWSAD